MTTPRKYPLELKDRAVRLVLEAQKPDEALTMNQAVVRIAPRVGANHAV